MSTISRDISYAVVNAIYGLLNGFVVYAGTTYPVHKSIPKSPPSIYVRIGEVVDREEGTKDDFVYYGSVSVIICDESQTMQADKKKAYNILNVVRGLLKPSKSSVPGGFIGFSHGGKGDYVDLGIDGKPLIRVVDTYKFIIE